MAYIAVFPEERDFEGDIYGSVCSEAQRRCSCATVIKEIHLSFINPSDLLILEMKLKPFDYKMKAFNQKEGLKKMHELLYLEQTFFVRTCLYNSNQHKTTQKQVLRSLYSDPLFNTRKVEKSTHYINPNVLCTASNVPVLAPFKIIRVGSAVLPEPIY